MNKRGRLVLLTAAMSGMAAAALSVARRRRSSALTETATAPQSFEDVVLAVDVIEDAERASTEVAPRPNTPQHVTEGSPERSYGDSRAHELEATAQPATTIPPEQQPGGGPPHR